MKMTALEIIKYTKKRNVFILYKAEDYINFDVYQKWYDGYFTWDEYQKFVFEEYTKLDMYNLYNERWQEDNYYQFALELENICNKYPEWTEEDYYEEEWTCEELWRYYVRIYNEYIDGECDLEEYTFELENVLVMLNYLIDTHEEPTPPEPE